MGLALRLSIEIGLPELVHSPRVRTTLPDWAIRSIERTWRLVSAIDKIRSAETGKPEATNFPLLALDDPGHEKSRTPPDLFISALSVNTMMSCRQGCQLTRRTGHRYLPVPAQTSDTSSGI